MKQNPPPGTERLLSLMEQVAAFMRSPAVGEWADLELTKPQLRALLLVRDSPQRMGQLAAALGTSLPSATSLIDRLAARGLVERVADPEDRRVVVCRLTESGTAQVERLRRAGRAHLEALVACLTAEEAEAVERGLAVLAAAVVRQAAGGEGGEALPAREAGRVRASRRRGPVAHERGS